MRGARSQPGTKWRNVSKAEYLKAPQELRGIRDIGATRYYYVKEK